MAKGFHGQVVQDELKASRTDTLFGGFGAEQGSIRVQCFGGMVDLEDIESEVFLHTRVKGNLPGSSSFSDFGPHSEDRGNFTEWHYIANIELDELSDPETGVECQADHGAVTEIVTGCSVKKCSDLIVAEDPGSDVTPVLLFDRRCGCSFEGVSHGLLSLVKVCFCGPRCPLIRPGVYLAIEYKHELVITEVNNE